MTLDEIGARLEAARGKIDRIYCHWTGAPYQLVECLAYHVVIDRGGYCHVIHEDFTECLAHTWHRNSRSIGVALACCRDACCYYDAPSGVDWGVSRQQRRRWKRLRCSARGLWKNLDCRWQIFTHMQRWPLLTGTGSVAVIRICAGIYFMSPITVTAAGWFPAVS